MSLFHALLARLRSEQGQTFVEYALILAVVVVGVLLAVTWGGLGTAIQAAITRSPPRSKRRKPQSQSLRQIGGGSDRSS